VQRYLFNFNNHWKQYFYLGIYSYSVWAAIRFSKKKKSHSGPTLGEVTIVLFLSILNFQSFSWSQKKPFGLYRLTGITVISVIAFCRCGFSNAIGTNYRRTNDTRVRTRTLIDCVQEWDLWRCNAHAEPRTYRKLVDRILYINIYYNSNFEINQLYVIRMYTRIYIYIHMYNIYTYRQITGKSVLDCFFVIFGSWHSAVAALGGKTW